MAWTDYDRHARTRPRDDLWGQVRRTVKGQPVGADQIDMIVAAIQHHLGLAAADTLLDLACGNGALTARLHGMCAASVGVDVSPYLIGVAEERFAAARHSFVVRDAADYTETAVRPERFTKALCYGSLSYLDDAAVVRLLHGLHRRFRNLDRVLLGNLPDPARACAFFPPGMGAELRQPRSDLGAWRDAAAIAALAGPGWTVRAHVMPPGFFAAHYRFDAVLERVPCQ